MPKETIKKFKVTNSMRLSGSLMKILFFFALGLLAFAIVGLAVCLIGGLGDNYIIGLLVILGCVSGLWVFGFKLTSVNSFGFSMVSFGDRSMRFYLNENTDDLYWSNVTECGMLKNLWIKWVYISDHPLSAEEIKSFPDNTSGGTFYFEYEEAAFDEFMKYLPEEFHEKMLTERDAMIKKK